MTNIKLKTTKQQYLGQKPRKWKTKGTSPSSNFKVEKSAFSSFILKIFNEDMAIFLFVGYLFACPAVLNLKNNKMAKYLSKYKKRQKKKVLCFL